MGVAAVVSPKPQFLWPPAVWAVLPSCSTPSPLLTADIEYPARLEFIQVLVLASVPAILNNLYTRICANHQPHPDPSGDGHLQLCGGPVYESLHAGVNLRSRDVGRASGTFLQPDHFCAFLAMILPVVLSQLLVGRVKP